MRHNHLDEYTVEWLSEELRETRESRDRWKSEAIDLRDETVRLRKRLTYFIDILDRLGVPMDVRELK